MDHFATIAAERRALADLLDTVTATDWETPSLCGAWTVRDVAAHLVVPHTTSTARFLAAMLAARGSFDRANAALALREGKRPTSEIVADLRRHADSRFTPPGGVGSIAPLTDVVVHGQDIALPLQLTHIAPDEARRAVLDFLFTPKAARGFVHTTPPPLTYVATDLDWHTGAGDTVEGPAIALILTLTGRPALTGQLSGPGADRLIGGVAA